MNCKISDFSKITSLSVKALRYYDEEQILTPSFWDRDTAYRYYSEEDKNFRPGEPVTRAEAATQVYRALEYLKAHTAPILE